MSEVFSEKRKAAIHKATSEGLAAYLQDEHCSDKPVNHCRACEDLSHCLSHLIKREGVTFLVEVLDEVAAIARYDVQMEALRIAKVRGAK